MKQCNWAVMVLHNWQYCSKALFVIQPNPAYNLPKLWWDTLTILVPTFQLHQMFQQQQVEPGADKKPDCFPILSDPSSLCFVHHREASDSSVIGTSYTPLPQQYDVLNKSPQSSPSKNAPHRGIKTGMLDVAHCGLRPAGSSASPAHSLQSTPSQSPRLNRKYNGFGIIQKPGAIDNTPLIVPVTSSKVKPNVFYQASYRTTCM